MTNVVHARIEELDKKLEQLETQMNTQNGNVDRKLDMILAQFDNSSLKQAESMI